MLIDRVHELSRQWLMDELSAAGLSGIVPSHGDVLALLFRRGSATMQELASFAHRTKPTMTILVNKLVRMGFVQRQKSVSDARSTIITLTPAGEALRPVFDSISARLITLVHARLSDDEIGVLHRLLEQMIDGIIDSQQIH